MFLSIVAIVFAIFGIGLLVVPSEFMAFYGLTFNPAGVLLARVFGSTVIAQAIVYWAARNAGSSDLMQAILYAGVVSNVIDAILAWYGISSGVLNSMGWALVVLHVLFTVGFAYFAFGKR